MDEIDFKLLAILKETQNITRAADLLYVTQSSLSKRIAAIEQELGITLILRSRQGIVFTPAGEIVLAGTVLAAEQLKQMRETLDAGRGYICGTLHAGISVNFALYHFPDILSAYRTLYPRVDTHITTDHSRKLYAQLTEGAIEVAIVRGDYPWKGERILLERETICVIYHEKFRGMSLAGIPYIGRKTDITFEREVARWMRENHLAPKQHGICVDSITTCVEMVNRGLGWAIVPEVCLQEFDYIVQPLNFHNGEPFVRSTYIMYFDTVLQLPQVKAFIDTVISHKTEARTRT